MLPIAIVNSTIPVQVPLAGTTLPGSAATHVPYDNVAPSISNSQVNNNASPNSTAAATGDQPQVTEADPDSEEQSAATPANAAQYQSAGAQATFLAQLMSQDGSPPAQAVLIQYEKLSAIGLAKYKPSNAAKPTIAAPSSAFGQILQQSKPATPVQSTAPAQTAARQPAPASIANTDATTQETIASTAAPTPPAPRPPAPARNNNSSGTSQPAANAAPQIISAYTATASRVNSQSLESTTELA